ncbi:PREDICTED: E3 ubiquitin-protein ligase RFWD3-like [Amphimedon queenslandica]|uniref:RING-type E3 ubiquitin transferase n=1 Tax=Amphimedon queenslandica TaxID=400682 RepID=A0A1X7UX47_AMPQE|nr:PREDICTED: E3 ubiquitin-protein ligase RFWD3-like [Amphimedon queenslandica]|eukprot:XP_019851837.1 PREDICTED: E3 ubiquitin-protein ligase RFWD3-like [Amphimedon queenslandica]
MEEEQRETQADMQEEEREEEEEDVIEIQSEEEEEENIHRSHDVPVLPNLALEAIERLRENPPLDEDSLCDDFQPTRKKRKQNQKKDMSMSDENEGQTCSICFEGWSNSGNHRIASLRCGHLFGYICIEKWLKGQGERCPQCNAKAKKGDIRIIYTKSISAIDTTERDRALMELEEEKLARIAAQKSEGQALIQYQLAKAECERVKEELRACKQQLEQYRGRGIVSEPALTNTPEACQGIFQPYKVIPISSTGGARVLGLQDSSMLVVSRPSSNSLFPGFGLTKISLLDDMRSREFVRIHDKCIRDVQFSPQGGNQLVLTTGLDKTLQLTSLQSNIVVQKYSLPAPGWSCCWDTDESNYFMCGLANGSLYQYDLRRTDSYLSEIKSTTSSSSSVPITALTYVPFSRSSSLSCSGILAGTLDGGLFWEKPSASESYKLHPFSYLSGNCTSISFEPVTRHCMASFRPSKRLPASRHIVCQLKNTPLTEPISCQVVHSFNGGTTNRVLSRSLLFQRPGTVGQLLVAYGNESLNKTCLCDVGSAAAIQNLSTDREPCLDIVSITHPNERDALLALLTEHKLHLYQWT